MLEQQLQHSEYSQCVSSHGVISLSKRGALWMAREEVKKEIQTIRKIGWLVTLFIALCFFLQRGVHAVENCSDIASRLVF
jgi:hypothetical protein